MDFYGMTGEKLGTIGQVEGKSPRQGNLPQWKKDFLEKPSVSIRKGIAWGFSSPYEDTSTLVLTSPKSDFVDIRFPVQPDPSKPLASDPAFWAFSGSATTTFDPDTSEITMPYSAHCVWKHDIDSKGPGTTDEGDMFLLPNGDCMEIGMMENHKTRKVEMYKEYWSSPASELGSGGLRKTPCVVAKTRELVDQGRAPQTGSGVIIRVGDYCQGIVQQSRQDGTPGVLVERWTKCLVEKNPALSDQSDVSETTAAEWLKDWRSNTSPDDQVEVAIPCMWACGDNRKVGDEIVVHAITWRITEVVL
ncbi:uncharacterized protein Z518_08338 [Rhinocladiella mackenziei CBS 650.93]|uniref:Protein HRI1 n=1 Tax=Rhinocladiella mackenziei CBS 650.93 TaxID=1442369 RepID=A0A0D2FKA5_9EURO|nr:uncharacterized protein Z518_08338 [Rhinocladiella mackenziei CBS 650.93]KIX02397.1 hypothetical protein Z518_08338 [Rhinocladiella mackenziei CBS 650.93]